MRVTAASVMYAFPYIGVDIVGGVSSVAMEDVFTSSMLFSSTLQLPRSSLTIHLPKSVGFYILVIVY